MSKSQKKAVKRNAPPKKKKTKKAVAKKAASKKTAKKKASPKKEAAPIALRAEVQILWKAYCKTQQKYISANWTTKEQAENEAQPHIDANHQVRYDQNISG
ncbi:MAG TPA: hypothetical protein VK543_18995 [Puia sp.]|nr:hypothetical protein [Puia sp.]